MPSGCAMVVCVADCSGGTSSEYRKRNNPLHRKFYVRTHTFTSPTTSPAPRTLPARGETSPQPLPLFLVRNGTLYPHFPSKG